MIAAFPPMGWNSWDCYGAAVTEETVRSNARFMAEHLKQYGWEYIVVDIQWYQPSASTHEYVPFAPLCMDANGRLQPAENRFPSARDGAGFRIPARRKNAERSVYVPVLRPDAGFLFPGNCLQTPPYMLYHP